MSKGWHHQSPMKTKGIRLMGSLWDESVLSNKKKPYWKCTYAIDQISVAVQLSETLISSYTSRSKFTESAAIYLALVIA